MNGRTTIDSVLPNEDLDAIEVSTCTIDAAAVTVAEKTIAELDARGEAALLEYVSRYDESPRGARVLFDRDDLRSAVDRIEPDVRRVIERSAERIRAFAELQASRLSTCRMRVEDAGVAIGHDIVPMESAGCYAPGGRFPLPSSVLMSVIPAVVAGVGSIRLASPRPTAATLAAGWFAGVDALLAAGGAHAIGAMALGVLGPRCDIVVGPGNRYVTAAKAVVSGTGAPGGRPIAIDALAGPSELMVIADDGADPRVVALDLVAQAEHDSDARVWLVTTSESLRSEVRSRIGEVLLELPDRNRGIAEAAIGRGAAIVVEDEAGMIEAADRLGPEHLEIMTRDPRRIARRVKHAGAVFLGFEGAEVFGDYGVGPNHILPTGGSARARGGLSVMDFLRVRTWIESDRTSSSARLAADCAVFARIEGLEGHARSAEARSTAMVSP